MTLKEVLLILLSSTGGSLTTLGIQTNSIPFLASGITILVAVFCFVLYVHFVKKKEEYTHIPEFVY